uniref:Uncharacterized protein n=1 Tax=viral metagenome TaxID=1070528 RepID=A0A6C0B5E3_9ZZZZ
MESIKPTPLKKFVINTSTFGFNVLSAEKLFHMERVYFTLRNVLRLEIAIVITIIINMLISNTSLYNIYVKNVEPSSIKIGKTKIKTRKLIAMLIKYIVLTLIFSIVVFLR